MTDQRQTDQTETTKTEIKTLTESLLRPGDLTKTLSDPKTRSLVKYIDRLTRDLTPSYGLGVIFWHYRSAVYQTRKTARKIGDSLSGDLTLETLEVKDRVRLSKTGLLWSVITKTRETDSFNSIIQVRSENGHTRTYNLSDPEKRDRQVWLEETVSSQDFDVIISLLSSLEDLRHTLSHKVKIHDLKSGDMIKDLRDPRPGEIDRQYMTWIVMSSQDPEIVSLSNSLSEYRTQSLDSLSDDLHTGDQVLTGHIFDPETEDPEDPETEDLETRSDLLSLSIGDSLSFSETGQTWRVSHIDPDPEKKTVYLFLEDSDSFRSETLSGLLTGVKIGKIEIFSHDPSLLSDGRQIDPSLFSSLLSDFGQVFSYWKENGHDWKIGDCHNMTRPKSLGLRETISQYLGVMVMVSEDPVSFVYLDPSETPDPRSDDFEIFCQGLRDGLSDFWSDSDSPDPDQDPDKDPGSDPETGQNDPSDPEETDPDTETPILGSLPDWRETLGDRQTQRDKIQTDPETGQSDPYKKTVRLSSLDLGDRLKMTRDGIIWIIVSKSRDPYGHIDLRSQKTGRSKTVYLSRRDASQTDPVKTDPEVWPVKDPETPETPKDASQTESDPESIRQKSDQVSSILEDPEETPETEETPEKTPETESETLTLQTGDRVSSKFRLTIWRVSQIDPESETVSLVNTLDQTETLTQTVRSLLWSFHITLLIVHRDGSLYQRDIHETPSLTLQIGDLKSSDPEIVSPEIERPKTWRDRQTGSLRDRLFSMVKESDVILSQYYDFLSRVKTGQETISLLERLQSDPEDLTRQDWKEIGDRQSDPSYYIEKTRESLSLYDLDLEDLTEDLKELTDSVSTLHTEIFLRERDPSDLESEDLEIFSGSWSLGLRGLIVGLDSLLSLSLLDLKTNKKTAVKVCQDLAMIRQTLGDPEDSVRLSDTLTGLISMSGLWSQEIDDQWKDPEIVSLTSQTLRLLINTMESLTLEDLRPSLLSSVFVGSFADQVWSLLESIKDQTEDLISDVYIDLSLRDLDGLDRYSILTDRLYNLWSDLEIISDSQDFETPSKSETLGLTRSILRLTESLTRLDDHFLEDLETETETLRDYLKSLTRDLESGDCLYIFSDLTIDRVKTLTLSLEDWKTRRDQIKTLIKESDLRSDYPSLETLKSEEIKTWRDRLTAVSSLLASMEDPSEYDDLSRLETLESEIKTLIKTLDSLFDFGDQKDPETDPETRQNDPETGQTSDQTERPETDPKDQTDPIKSLIFDLSIIVNMSPVNLLTSDSQVMIGDLKSLIWSLGSDFLIKTLTPKESDLFWSRTLAILSDLETLTEDLTISLKDPVSRDDLRSIMEKDPDLVTSKDARDLTDLSDGLETLCLFLDSLYYPKTDQTETLTLDLETETPETPVSDYMIGVSDPDRDSMTISRRLGDFVSLFLTDHDQIDGRQLSDLLSTMTDPETVRESDFLFQVIESDRVSFVSSISSDPSLFRVSILESMTRDLRVCLTRVRDLVSIAYETPDPRKSPKISFLRDFVQTKSPDQIKTLVSLRDSLTRLLSIIRSLTEKESDPSDFWSGHTLDLETVSQEIKILINDLARGYKDPKDPINRLEIVSDRLYGLTHDLTSLLIILKKDPETVKTMTGDFDDLSYSIGSFETMTRVIYNSGHDMTPINIERLTKRLEKVSKYMTIPDPETLKSETLIKISVFGSMEEKIRSQKTSLDRQIGSLLSSLKETRKRLSDPSLYDHYAKKTEETERLTKSLRDLETLSETISGLVKYTINDLTLEISDLPFSIYRSLGLSESDFDPVSGQIIDPETRQNDPSETDQV